MASESKENKPGDLRIKITNEGGRKPWNWQLQHFEYWAKDDSGWYISLAPNSFRLIRGRSKTLAGAELAARHAALDYNFRAELEKDNTYYIKVIDL